MTNQGINILKSIEDDRKVLERLSKMRMEMQKRLSIALDELARKETPDGESGTDRNAGD